MAVFFATYATSFDFEDDIELVALFEKFAGELEVFLEGDDRTIEHVALEKWAFAFGDALA